MNARKQFSSNVAVIHDELDLQYSSLGIYIYIL